MPTLNTRVVNLLVIVALVFSANANSASASRSAHPEALSPAWSSTSSLNTERYSHGTATWGNSIYVLGGTNESGQLSSIERATINANGTLGAWQAIGNLTTARSGFRASAINGYLYVIGGSSGTNMLNTVEYAVIHSDGSLGNWQTTNSLITAREFFGLTSANGYMYAIGGTSASAILNSVEYAYINADGSLGVWQTTSSLNSSRKGMNVTAAHGYIYVPGGHNPDKLTSVEYAAIQPGGSLGAWNTTSSIQTARTYHGVVTDGSSVYVIGGSDLNNDSLASVEVAKINSDHSLSAWQSTPGLAQDRFSLGAARADGGGIYVTGGHRSGVYLTSVEWTTTAPIAGHRVYIPLVRQGNTVSTVTVTPVQRTDANGNTTIHLPQADLQVSIKDTSGTPLANARVIAISDGQKALVIAEDEQHRYYPAFSEVSLTSTQTIGNHPDFPIIIVALIVVDIGVSAYGVFQYLQDHPETIEKNTNYTDYCTTVEQMANTLGLITLLSWLGNPADPVGHVVGIVGGVGAELWLDDILTDYWCANDWPHPAKIRQHNFPNMETPFLKLLGPCDDRPQQPICERSTSTLTGVVKNARTGAVVSGAEVMINPAGPKATTNGSGQYIINTAPVGYHTVTASQDGYVPTTKRVEVATTGASADFDLSPVGTETEYRFVLTWGTDPRDLDSHLWLPSDHPFHIYYSNKGNLSAHPYAALDLDDRNSFGPETITMVRSYPGAYQYAVYLFAGVGSLATSGAKVAIYRGDALLRVVDVPTTGSGAWWVVATVDGSTGTVMVQNYITSSSPGPYTVTTREKR